MQYFTKTEVDALLDAAQAALETQQECCEKLASDLQEQLNENAKLKAVAQKAATSQKTVLEKVACSSEYTNNFVDTLVTQCLISPDQREKYARAILDDPNAALLLATKAVKQSSSAFSQGRGVEATKQASTSEDSLPPVENDPHLLAFIDRYK